MINILIPIAGKSTFFDSEEHQFPKAVIEINGKPMIQLVLENFLKLNIEKRFIFIVNEKDCQSYHLDNILKLLTDKNCIIIKTRGETKGAVCSAMLAIQHINNDEPLIISNADSIIDENFNNIISKFQDKNIDAGVVCFDSIHPKWSYVRLNEKNKIVETAEKRPISRNAIAGFYYFKKGSYFINASMISIKKDASVNGLFFIAPVINELVLQGMNLEAIKIDEGKYHSFYSPQKIKEYEMLNKKSN